MEKYYLLFALIFYIVGVLYFGIKYLLEKSRADSLQKQLDGNLTDAEKLHIISEIYHSIDFEKVGNELLNDWENFLINIRSESDIKIEKFHDFDQSEIPVTSCCKIGPIINENYCPNCGKKIIK